MNQTVRNADTPRIPSRISKQCIHPTLWLTLDAAVALSHGLLDNTPWIQVFFLATSPLPSLLKFILTVKRKCPIAVLWRKCLQLWIQMAGSFKGIQWWCMAFSNYDAPNRYNRAGLDYISIYAGLTERHIKKKLWYRYGENPLSAISYRRRSWCFWSHPVPRTN
jgi:hypothetical protein